ncbi:MAG TPA: DUF1330 domain-containing protein [Syntrophomonadaceae bacterium]|nr:DUF1330 domain-containing protein [Syntrophomonadaceae bacterium]HPR94285.1 DUF1330 domain-containing protein [Syntrophomonadaceae bacterium]
MPAYVLIEIEIHDKSMYFQYIEKARPIVESYGGNYIIRGGKTEILFGDWEPERIILIEFPARENIERCFHSTEYLEIKHLRENSTNTRAIILEGYDHL